MAAIVTMGARRRNQGRPVPPPQAPAQQAQTQPQSLEAIVVEPGKLFPGEAVLELFQVGFNQVVQGQIVFIFAGEPVDEHDKGRELDATINRDIPTMCQRTVRLSGKEGRMRLVVKDKASGIIAGEFDIEVISPPPTKLSRTVQKIRGMKTLAMMIGLPIATLFIIWLAARITQPSEQPGPKVAGMNPVPSEKYVILWERRNWVPFWWTAKYLIADEDGLARVHTVPESFQSTWKGQQDGSIVPLPQGWKQWDFAPVDVETALYNLGPSGTSEKKGILRHNGKKYKIEGRTYFSPPPRPKSR